MREHLLFSTNAIATFGRFAEARRQVLARSQLAI
jgi:hypothetical protein